MVEELMTRSSMEAPSFGRSVGATAELSTVTTEIAGKDDLLLDDFEFAFASIKLDPDAAMEASADTIFNNGWILPVYPIFNGDLVDGGLKPPEEEKLEGGIGHVAMGFERQSQRLGLRSSSSSISSDAKELNKISGATAKYCVLKSNSTGSGDLESGRLRLRDIVFGRSQSEGDKLLLVSASREKKMEKSRFFLFSSSHKSKAREAEKKAYRGKENRNLVKESDIVTAHRMFFGRGMAGGGQMAMAGSRRSFLPYRQELIAGCFYCHSRRNRC